MSSSFSQLNNLASSWGNVYPTWEAKEAERSWQHRWQSTWQSSQFLTPLMPPSRSGEVPKSTSYWVSFPTLEFMTWTCSHLHSLLLHLSSSQTATLIPCLVLGKIWCRSKTMVRVPKPLQQREDAPLADPSEEAVWTVQQSMCFKQVGHIFKQTPEYCRMTLRKRRETLPHSDKSLTSANSSF